jgi:hypothetical protein
MKQLLNNYTIDSILEKITEKNGWEQCVNGITRKCVYRNDKGRACAAGVFIPDNFPGLNQIVLKNKSIKDIYEGLKEFMPLCCHDMQSLQYLHDTDDWTPERIRQFLESD